MNLIWTIRRPAPLRERLQHHLPALLIAGAILLIAALLPLHGLPFRTCVFSRVTHHPCLTCGYTRGFINMAHGQWAPVARDCPAAILAYLLTVFIFAWNAVALLCRAVLERGLLLRGRWLALHTTALALLVGINWIYRLSMGFN